MYYCGNMLEATQNENKTFPSSMNPPYDPEITFLGIYSKVSNQPVGNLSILLSLLNIIHHHQDNGIILGVH